MRIPQIYYGTYKDVNRIWREKIKSVIKSQSWEESFSNEKMIDSENTPGLFIMDGPGSLLINTSNFHFFISLEIVSDFINSGKVDAEFGNTTFKYFISNAWSLLSLISLKNVMWVYPQHRHALFIDACAKHWDEINSVNARYSNGSIHSYNLWAIPNNIKYVLANMGVDEKLLNSNLQNNSISDLLLHKNMNSKK